MTNWVENNEEKGVVVCEVEGYIGCFVRIVSPEMVESKRPLFEQRVLHCVPIPFHTESVVDIGLGGF